MKKIVSLLCLSLVIVLTSCEGPQGPPGLDGLDGRDGINGQDAEIAKIFELENVNFSSDNNFAIGFTFPQPIFESDIVLVYRLEDVFDGKDIWEPLPTATIFLDGGTDVLYRFNFSFDDVDILLESNNPEQVPTDLTNNQVFRIVVVPAAFATTKNANELSLQSIMKEYNLTTKDIRNVIIN